MDTLREIKLPVLTCLRCGHRWTPRQERLPLRCARCRSQYWNRPRRAKKKT